MKVVVFIAVLGVLAGVIVAGVLSAPPEKSEGVCAVCAQGSGTKEVAVVSAAKKPMKDEYDPEELETAIFGAGCFWGVEVTFRRVEGIVDVAVGYSGGHKEEPTYKEVCAGATGHAEVVQVTYDPEAVSYEALLEVFWNGHDPTQLNRQGPDVGAQYRSVIFYSTPKQEVCRQGLEKEPDGCRQILTADSDRHRADG